MWPNEILLLLNLKVISKATQEHVYIHFQNLKGPGFTLADAEHLKDALIAQVLILLSESEYQKNIRKQVSFYLLYPF